MLGVLRSWLLFECGGPEGSDETRAAAIFAAIDADGGGGVCEEEFRSGTPGGNLSAADGGHFVAPLQSSCTP